jgi:hypothetical protein
MKVQTVKAHSAEELGGILQKISKSSFKPVLAFVFVHISFNMNSIALLFDEMDIDCIGASSAGEFIDSDFERPAIVAMLIEIERKSFRIYSADRNNLELADVSKQIAEKVLKEISSPAFIVFSAGLANDGEIIIKSFTGAAGKKCEVFGGAASEAGKFASTYVFTRKNVIGDGIVALAFDTNRIAVKGLMSGGWKPIGIVRTITKSVGNKVFTIDNEPALDLIARYSRLSANDFEDSRQMMANVSTKFQLQLQRKDSYPVMRASYDANKEEGSLTFTGLMPEGSKVQFSILPSFDVVDNVISDLQEFKSENEDPDAVLLFSCKGREMIFGPVIHEEVDRICDLWDAPLAGFLSYGEIGNIKNNSEFHGMMCSLVLLKENETEATA